MQSDDACRPHVPEQSEPVPEVGRWHDEVGGDEVVAAGEGQDSWGSQTGEHCGQLADEMWGQVERLASREFLD